MIFKLQYGVHLGLEILNTVKKCGEDLYPGYKEPEK